MGRALGPSAQQGALSVVKAIRDTAALQARLGHIFRDERLLDHALTHVSAVKSGNVRLQSYQRLEFLGDRVLGLAIADMLSSAFPEADEGELARRMSELVRRETCAEVAMEWDIGSNVRLGTGEVQSGGRKRQTILADACEAVIGAVYLDSGFETAKRVIASAWAARLNQPTGDKRDAKTHLQEIAQAAKRGVPVYRETSRTGPAHRTTFVVAVEVDGLGVAEGTGQSKREAEQMAAQALIHTLQANTGTTN
ncbi:MAG: ribonuclease III [Beijerinckiaceae bacterium]